MIHRILVAMMSVLVGICSSVLIAIGLIRHWPRHVIFGGIVLVAWVVILIVESKLPSRFDWQTGRFYYRADRYDNPSKGECSLCRARFIYPSWGYLIFTPRFRGRRRYGIDCPLHGLVWFDKVKEM